MAAVGHLLGKLMKTRNKGVNTLSTSMASVSPCRVALLGNSVLAPALINTPKGELA